MRLRICAACRLSGANVLVMIVKNGGKHFHKVFTLFKYAVTRCYQLLIIHFQHLRVVTPGIGNQLQQGVAVSQCLIVNNQLVLKGCDEGVMQFP